MRFSPLISLSDLLFSLHRNATYFCVLILYLVTLPNSLMNSSSFLVPSLDFLCIVSGHLETMTVFLLVWILFTYFSLTAVVRTSKTILNKSGESGPPSLDSDLREIAFSFSPFIEYDVSCGFVIYGLYYVEVCSFYTHFLEVFFFLIINGCWILLKAFSASV